jgi:hypothetical protein
MLIPQIQLRMRFAGKSKWPKYKNWPSLFAQIAETGNWAGHLNESLFSLQKAKIEWISMSRWLHKSFARQKNFRYRRFSFASNSDGYHAIGQTDQELKPAITFSDKIQKPVPVSLSKIRRIFRGESHQIAGSCSLFGHLLTKLNWRRIWMMLLDSTETDQFRRMRRIVSIRKNLHEWNCKKLNSRCDEYS